MCTEERLKNLLRGDADFIVGSKLVEELKITYVSFEVGPFFFGLIDCILLWQTVFFYLAGEGEMEKKKKKKNSPCLHPKFEFATDVEGRLSNLEGGSNMLIFKMGSEEKGIFG